MKTLSFNEINAVSGGARTYEEKMAHVREDAMTSGGITAIILGIYSGPIGILVGFFTGACAGAALSSVLTDW